MHCTIRIHDDLYWVGGSDRRLALFENVYPIPNGVSYNAYVVLDEKTVLLDTVDKAVSEQFFENLGHVLNGRKLDYCIVDHMEPDHCATLSEVLLRYPDVKIVCNAKIQTMVKQFFDADIADRAVIVKEGDTLTTGRHTFAFVMAPMVHWPEVMVTYDTTDKVLFSADAFGTFGAINGNLFADQLDFEKDCLDEARRYYTNIVGKYGPQVQTLLKKAAKLDIAMICPLHGPVWRKDISWFIGKYLKWSAYQPEDDAVMIAYASVYGHTENAANVIAAKLAEKGVSNIRMYDVSVTHPSVIVSEAFRVSHIVFASTTYNAGIFVNMENVLHDIVAHNLQNRTIALVENGSWAPTAAGLMRKLLEGLKNCVILDETLTIRSAVKDTQEADIDVLVTRIAADLVHADDGTAAEDTAESAIDPATMFKLSYGLFVLTARGERDNGCIINTVTQITSQPNRISIAVNKANFTHDLVKASGVFNVSILDTSATFDLFKRFGFQSGRDADKFAGFEHVKRSVNGLPYVTEAANGFISARVIEALDEGTHTVFIAEVTEAQVLSDRPSLTYAHYFAHVKPQPVAVQEQTGWVCKICGYIYEGDTLPEDFICPLCKHPASDFERIK